MQSHSSIAPVVAGATAALVGYLSSASVVLSGLLHVGASRGEAESGLLALSVAMGTVGLAASVRLRQPISVAWSTPGAALLATESAPRGGFETATLAFLMCGLLITATGALPVLAAAVANIPAPVAAAMLAGVLLPLCARAAVGVTQLPTLCGPAAVTWLLLTRWARQWAVAGAVAATAIAVGVAGARPGASQGISLTPQFHAHLPHGNLAAAAALAIPLYLVTMAAQNLPGLAILRLHGYHPPIRPLLCATGIATVAVAPVGGHAVNLAALTAAMTSGPDAHPDPSRRWLAGACSGLGFIVLGLVSGPVIILSAMAPPLAVETLAGLALVVALGGALTGATEQPRLVMASTVTFAVTASSAHPLGVAAPMWGLVSGITVTALTSSRHRTGPSPVPDEDTTTSGPIATDPAQVTEEDLAT